MLFFWILDLKYFLCSMWRNYLWQVIARYDLSSSRYLLTWHSCSPFPTRLMSVRPMLSLMSVTSLSVLALVVSVSPVSRCTGHVSCWKIRLLMSLLHQSRDFITILEFWGDMSAKNFLYFSTKLFRNTSACYDAFYVVENRRQNSK